MKAGEIPEGRFKKSDMETFKKLEALGIPMKDAKSIRDAYQGNMLVDNTRGIVHIGEVIELIIDGFEQVMNACVLAREPGMKMLVRITDLKLHEDAIHRGPAQVLPAVRDGLREAINMAKPAIFEPLQVLQIDAPSEYMGEVSKLIQNKRGQLIDMKQEGVVMTVKAKLPVAEMFGLSSDLRSATSGRGVYFIVDQVFEKLPEVLQNKVITNIRNRKGLTENQ
jgi:elongation factor 2